MQKAFLKTRLSQSKKFLLFFIVDICFGANIGEMFKAVNKKWSLKPNYLVTNFPWAGALEEHNAQFEQDPIWMVSFPVRNINIFINCCPILVPNKHFYPVLWWDIFCSCVIQCGCLWCRCFRILGTVMNHNLWWWKILNIEPIRTAVKSEHC